MVPEKVIARARVANKVGEDPLFEKGDKVGEDPLFEKGDKLHDHVHEKYR